jgi:hypothetical protein
MQMWELTVAEVTDAGSFGLRRILTVGKVGNGRFFRGRFYKIDSYRPNFAAIDDDTFDNLNL